MPFESAQGSRIRPIVAHVEAGLRSRDDDMPEEINRRLTDSISDLLFVSEPSGVANLEREGAPRENVFFVGNVMIDSLLAIRERSRASTILESLGLSEGTFGVVTLHRPSNVDDPNALARLLGVLEACTSGLRLVFPAHPRTRAQLVSGGIALSPERWVISESLGYVDFIHLIASARILLTDSGGVQEETTVLGVPCVTLRDTTERPVTIEEGSNILAGTSENGIRRAVNQALGSPPVSRRPDLWDGNAARRIVAKLRESFPSMLP
jgi:UDP-N-acetylglucosamine 2-epimerase (non-hydrolysing)